MQSPRLRDGGDREGKEDSYEVGRGADRDGGASSGRELRVQPGLRDRVPPGSDKPERKQQDQLPREGPTMRKAG